MFWKIYAGAVTAVAVGLYAHIRHIEGWMKGVGALIDAQLKAEANTDENAQETPNAE